jgi:hypothetical protein
MATLGELKTRVITETNRDDLADDLATALDTCIAQAVSYYANQRFWFNETIVTAICSIGSEYVQIPANLVWFDGVNCLVGAIKTPMTRRSLWYIENLAGTVNTRGQPTEYAVLDGQIRVWPKPSSAYTLTFVGLTNPGVPASDTASNMWTTDAYDLIAYRTKFLLYRDVLRDEDGARLATAAEQEALSNLIALTGQTLTSGRMRASW